MSTGVAPATHEDTPEDVSFTSLGLEATADTIQIPLFPEQPLPPYFLAGDKKIRAPPDRTDAWWGYPRDFVPHIEPGHVGPNAKNIINSASWNHIMSNASRLG